MTLRPLRHDDEGLGLLLRWLTDPRVLEFHEGRDRPATPESIRETYGARAAAATGVEPLVERDDRRPE